MRKSNKGLNFPNRDKITKHVIESLGCYFQNSSNEIYSLKIPVIQKIELTIPLLLIPIDLPNWGTEAGIEGQILVPKEAICSEDVTWTNVDWFTAAFLLLESCHERTWELQQNNIKSYSVRLNAWDKRAWDHAWVNRIGIFLSLWANKDSQVAIIRGKPELMITHDVDVITKNLQLRLKQGAFNIFNSFRKFQNLMQLKSNLLSNFKFFFTKSEMNNIAEILSIEEFHGIKSLFNIHAKLTPRWPNSWLIDPSYSLQDLKRANIIRLLVDAKCEIGMHGSIKSAKKEKKFKAEKTELERILDKKIEYHRQHWLSLYWEKTFQIYDSNQIQVDSTLMFNDVSGFRNSACLRWHPWNFDREEAHKFTEIPTLVMDSHIYDYSKNSEIGLNRACRVIQEVKTVSGAGQILWHPHTLSRDFGWDEGFEQICSIVSVE
jgi:hypothetical protein